MVKQNTELRAKLSQISEISNPANLVASPIVEVGRGAGARGLYTCTSAGRRDAGGTEWSEQAEIGSNQ